MSATVSVSLTYSPDSAYLRTRQVSSDGAVTISAELVVAAPTRSPSSLADGLHIPFLSREGARQVYASFASSSEDYLALR